VREWTCSKSISSEEKAQEEHAQRKPFKVSELTKLRRGSHTEEQKWTKEPLHGEVSKTREPSDLAKKREG
jgi:hypothetical protein